VKLDSVTGLPVAGAGFTLYSDAACTAAVASAVSSESGMIALPIANEGTYYLKETTTPAGYKYNGSVYTISARISYEESTDSSGNPVIYERMAISSGLGTAGGAYAIYNTPIQDVDLSVNKVWNDGGFTADRPESIQVVLYRDGEAYDSATLSAANGWSHSWSKLSDAYEWSVDEANVPANYTKSVSSSGNAWTITNTRDTVTIKGVKEWKLNGYEPAIPESVTIHLNANGSRVASTTASAAGGWAFSFSAVPVYANGEKILYTISEDAVADFVPGVSGSAETGFTLTNSYEPGMGSLVISKSVNGSGADKGKAFTFTLTLSGMSGRLNYTGASSGSFDASRPLTFTLAHGQSITVSGILAGTTYTVVENAYSNYSVSSSNASGTIAAGNASHASFVNTYEADDSDAVVIPKTGDTGNGAAMPVMIGLAIMWLGVAIYVIKRKQLV